MTPDIVVRMVACALSDPSPNFNAAYAAITKYRLYYMAEKGLGDRLGHETALAELGLPNRYLNVLEDLGMLYVKDMYHVTEDQLRACPNVGPAFVQEIRQVLEGLPGEFELLKERSNGHKV